MIFTPKGIARGIRPFLSKISVTPLIMASYFVN